MNTRTALGVAGVVAVAVTFGIVAGLSLTGAPVDEGDATATATATGTATPTPTATPVLTTVSATTTPAPTPTPDATVSAPAVEYHVYQRVEYLRTSRGYDPLSLNASLREVARYHSERMALRGEVGHEGPDGETLEDRLVRFGVVCGSSTETLGRLRAGVPVENVDGRMVTYDTVKEIARGIAGDWMDRPTPKSEILRREWTETAVGVHVVEREEGAVVYATQVFCESA